MFGLGIWELLIILAIVLLLFGVKRIPQLGQSLGEGIRNFTTTFQEDEAEKKDKPKDSVDGSTDDSGTPPTTGNP